MYIFIYISGPAYENPLSGNPKLQSDRECCKNNHLVVKDSPDPPQRPRELRAPSISWKMGWKRRDPVTTLCLDRRSITSSSPLQEEQERGSRKNARYAPLKSQRKGQAIKKKKKKNSRPNHRINTTCPFHETDQRGASHL